MNSRIFLTLLPLFTAALNLAWASDPCDQATAKSTHSYYLDPTGIKTQEAALGAPHNIMASFEQEVKFSCLRVRQQMQSVGWGNAAACKGLLDPRASDSLGRAYFEGPNDPRRCLTTVGIDAFKRHMVDFLEAKDFGSDSNGHAYTSSDVRKLMKAVNINGYCSKKATLAEHFTCYAQSFEGLVSRLEQAEKLLDSRKQTVAEACGALNEAYLDTTAISLVAQFSKNRHRPENLSAKDYPAYNECRSYDFPKMFASCKTNPASTLLSDDAWHCLKIGIHTIWASSGFRPPSGMTNSFRDRLAELRSKAIELSVLERLCTLDSDLVGLFDESRKPSTEATKAAENSTRCQIAAFEELRKVSDWDSWLAKNSTKPLVEPSQYVPDLNAASCPVPTAPILGTASVTSTIATSLKAANHVTSTTTDDSSLNDVSTTFSAPKENEITLAEFAEKVEAQQKADLQKAVAELHKKFEKESPPALPPMPGVAPKDKAEALTAHYRTEAELIAAAKEELMRWKKHEPHNFNYAQFFLETEFSDQIPNPGQKHFQALLAELLKKKREYEEYAEKTTGSIDERIDALMAQMNTDFVKDYTAGNALLTNFLEKGGGNCEAESKLITNVLRDLKLEPGGDETLGVQLFDDHIQPVIFKRSTREVWVLHTREHFHGLIAPIYQPELLIKGYLAKRDPEEKSPVSDKELLIEDMTAQELAWAKAHGGRGKSTHTNTNLKLPKTGVVYGDDRPPSKAQITMNSAGGQVKEAKDFAPAKHSGGDRFGSSGAGSDSDKETFTHKGGLPKAVCLDDHTNPASPNYKVLQNFTAGQSNLIHHPAILFSTYLNERPVFRNCNDVYSYLVALSKKEEEKFFISLAEKELKARLHSTSIEDYRSLLSDPTQLTKPEWTVKRIEELRSQMSSLSFLFSGAGEGHNSLIRKNEAGTSPWQRKWVANNPELIAIRNTAWDLQNKILHNPKEFMPLRLAIGTEKWEALIESLDQYLFAPLDNLRGLAIPKIAVLDATPKWLEYIAETTNVSFVVDFRKRLTQRERVAQVKPEPRRTAVAATKKRDELMQSEYDLEVIGTQPAAASPVSSRSITAPVHIAIDPDLKAEDERKEQKPKPGKKAQLAASGSTTTKGLDSKTRSGHGPDASGSSQDLEPYAQYIMNPWTFATIIESIQSYEDDSFTEPVLRRWTSALSEALMTSTPELSNNDKMRAWFLVAGYHEIAKERDPSTLIYPAPDGSKMPIDLARLYAKWLTEPIVENVHFRDGPDQLGWGNRMDDIKSRYGSLENYRLQLETALKNH